MTRVADRADEWFEVVPGYLDTAAVGLPPRVATAALQTRIDEWAEGKTDPHSFDPDVGRARAAYSRIVATDNSLVGIVSQVSVVSGMVAASLQPGSVVLCAEEDFTSVLFPFLALSHLEVRSVPLHRLLDSVDGDVDLVAVSAVQSSNGHVLDLDQLVEVAAKYGARTFVDVTQAAGWLPIESTRFDVTACHAYKWLCAPRGAGFLTVSADALDWLQPTNAGWYAGEDPWTSIYRPPLRLASDARKFDVSPAWYSYSAAAPGLELLADIGVDAIREHSVGLANHFRSSIGLEASNSAIVSVATKSGPALANAGITVSSRDGRVRLSFFLYNTVEDADRAAAIVGKVAGQQT